MRKKLLFIALLLIAGTASAQITGITGNMDATMSAGQSQNFDLTVGVGSSGFNGELNFFIDGTQGLSLGLPTTPSNFQCMKEQRDGRDFVTCRGNVVTLGPNGNFHVVEPVTYNASVALPQESWDLMLAGTALSGAQMKTGTITPQQAKPDITLDEVGPGLTDTAPGPTTKSPGGKQTAIYLKNEGTAPGTFAIASNNNSFFTIDCAAGFTIPPQKIGICYINSTGQLPGVYTATITVSGADVRGGKIKVGIVLMVDVAPVGTPKPRIPARADATGGTGIAGPIVTLAASTPTTVSVVNEGDGPVRGVLSANVNWLILPQTEFVVAPGQTGSFDVSVDLSARPFAAQSGSLTSTVTLTYLLPVAAKTQRITALDNGGSSSVSITFVSTIPPQVTTAAPPSLDKKCPTCFGDTALFIPGVGHVVGSVGQFISDLVLFPKVGFGGPGTAEKRTLSNVDLYFTPLGATTSSASKATINALAPPSSAAFGDMVSTVYGNNSAVGTLQIRTLNFTIDEVTGLNANVFNVSNKAGTYGTSLPVFNSDLAAKGAEREYLTGLRKDATSHTNLYLQESQGSDITAAIDFYDASGNKIGSTTSNVPAFGAVQLGGSTVPNGTVSAAVSIASGNGAVHAYATPVDEASGDTWIVVDWSRILDYYDPTVYANGANVLIPVAGAAPGANNTQFKTDAAIMNVSNAPSTGTLRYWISGAAPVDKPINLNPLQTMVLNDITSALFAQSGRNIGYMTYTPTKGRVAITSRNYTTVAGSAATFGTAVPTIPLRTTFGNGGVAIGAGISKNGVIRIAGVEDSALSTVGAAQPGSFRSNFGLVEVGGQPATVQVTIYFNTNTDKTSSIQGGSATFNLPANGFQLTGNIANAVLGADRANVGDLHNVTVEFKVIDGSGRVVPFISSIDNGSGDSTFRVQ